MHDSLLNLARGVLGEYVSYSRLDELGEERSGHGNLCSIYLDERLRPMVRIVDGGKALNIDATAINLTDEERSAYFTAARAVRAKTDAINHKLNKLRLKGEKEIDDMQDGYLGMAIWMEEAPEANEEEAA